VEEVHDVEPQASTASDADVVKKTDPKLSPIRVTDDDPECNAFSAEYEAHALSKEKMSALVPAAAPTVTVTTLWSTCK
jgi:hypothetical protein